MKTFLFILLSSSVAVTAQSRKITFFHSAPATNEIVIAANEVFTITSAGIGSDITGGALQSFISIEKGGGKIVGNAGGWMSAFAAGAPVQMTGPARITLASQPLPGLPFTGVSWVTVDIQTQQPEKRSPHDSDQTRIGIESSTDLKTWVPAILALDTNAPPARFFRLELRQD